MARSFAQNSRSANTPIMIAKKRHGCDVQEDSQGSEEVGRWVKQNPTPDIGGKVIWKPTGEFWKVFTQKRSPNTCPKDTFEVDASLKGDAYLRSNAEQYIAAVEEWNQSDRSTRHRIPLPYLLKEWLTKALPCGLPPSSDM